MQLREENELIIGELQMQIEHLPILELEERIKTKEIASTSYVEKIYDVNNQLLRTKNRILAVNQKIFDKNEFLRNKMIYIDGMCTIPCGIEYIDMPLNSRSYLVQSFYNDLYHKYKEQPCQFLLLGLMPNPAGRFLKIEYLEDSEKQFAKSLDEYLKICSIREQIEALIDCIKCIQFNYITDDI